MTIKKCGTQTNAEKARGLALRNRLTAQTRKIAYGSVIPTTVSNLAAAVNARKIKMYAANAMLRDEPNWGLAFTDLGKAVAVFIPTK